MNFENLYVFPIKLIYTPPLPSLKHRPRDYRVLPARAALQVAPRLLLPAHLLLRRGILILCGRRDIRLLRVLDPLLLLGRLGEPVQAHRCQIENLRVVLHLLAVGRCVCAILRWGVRATRFLAV